MTSFQSLWWDSHSLWWDSEHIRNAYQSLVLLTSISVKCIFLSVFKTNNLNTCVILIKHLKFSDLLHILNHFSKFECLFVVKHCLTRNLYHFFVVTGKLSHSWSSSRVLCFQDKTFELCDISKTICAFLRDFMIG